MSTGVELPLVPAEVEPPRTAVTISRERYDQLARKAKRLSWLSLGAMTIEGAVAITAGVIAGSIALVGFGLDSAVEGFASTIIIWRLSGSRVFSERVEQRAQKLVAIQFFLLAPYVAVESTRTLADGNHPDVSPLGIGLSGPRGTAGGPVNGLY